MRKQNWLHSPFFDTVFILAPGAISALFVMLLPSSLSESSVPPFLWFFLVVGVDVSHVYSTLFKTYADKASWKQYGKLYLAVPILSFFVFSLLYRFGPLVFWSSLAYLAVFHFVRQQYGFMRLYERANPHLKGAGPFLSQTVIYTATLYPLLHWHCHLDKNFHWFVPGDFFLSLPSFLDFYFFFFYIAVLALYAFKEAPLLLRGEGNLPKNLVIFSTVVSWYVGIVHLNGDLAFTVTNVLAHGVPYMALISLEKDKRKKRVNSSPALLFCFVFFLSFSLAYGEEYLWSHLVWGENLEFFPEFLPNQQVFWGDTSVSFSFVIPLLALPQVTHYILDAFIWRRT